MIISRPDEQEVVELRSESRSEALSATDEVLLVGTGFDSAEQAWDAGRKWRGIAERAFAAVRMPADFGDNAARGIIVDPALGITWEDTGRPALNNEHGLMVFKSDPKPVFVTARPFGVRTTPALGRMVRALMAPEARLPATDRHHVAFDLYSASFFVQDIVEARFMLLMMAVEVLIDQQEHDARVRQHVDHLIDVTKTSALHESDKVSVTGTLKWLYRESVGRAGRKLAATLGDRVYKDLPPSKFFTKCYEIRSDLVHGRVPQPTRREVASFGANLELFVGHLIAGTRLLDSLGMNKGSPRGTMVEEVLDLPYVETDEEGLSDP